MAAVFLVTLYEYSPLFYIALVSVCFLVTSALVLGWFGLGVPVILRNSEETESSTRVLKKRMRQVKNPFGLEIPNPAVASVTRGVTLTPDCLEDCVLTCYWGCNVQKLHEALQKHVYCFRIKTPQALEDALYNEYLYKQQYFIKRNDKAEKYCQLPEDAQVVDFGPVPRARYPLVALLTLADEEDREIYDIIAMVAVIHIPDESYRLSCRILYQYLLLAQGQYHDLKLFSTSSSRTAAQAQEGKAVLHNPQLSSPAAPGYTQGVAHLQTREGIFPHSKMLLSLEAEQSSAGGYQTSVSCQQNCEIQIFCLP
ncbi:cell growth regulator with RING finger domain protein 1 isoform X2 [Vidua macroura]|uniref:cell growth regulator with RING finger domain protein 1 isoform X2 n=1 Tax=Vidua macroura TaxID=187451 RepID=UPI0023A7E5D8|nr:cell growth regulator with RING finger domain protein 1 isoform X2 [Vidua macroura]